LWADSALSKTFGGDRNFDVWQTKATILDSLGRKTEAAEAMKSAMPFMDQIQGYTYGYNLLLAKKTKEGYDVMKMVYDKYPNTLFTNIGMASAYSAMGDYKKALEYAQKALPVAKGGNKAEIERNIRDLQNGKDMVY
jgi:tetratricopeptide (TPR) repeat protein